MALMALAFWKAEMNGSFSAMNISMSLRANGVLCLNTR